MPVLPEKAIKKGGPEFNPDRLFHMHFSLARPLRAQR